jgi:DNA-damage-inducible protein J
MDKSAVIRARISPEIKDGVEKVFDRLGLTTSEAINVFCHQVVMSNGFPFEVKIPNAETLAAIQEGDAMLKDKKRKFKTKMDVYEELGL